MSDLPEGWAEIRTDEAGVLDLGRQRSPKYHSGSNMKPYLRVANVFEDRIDTTDVKTMHFEPEDFERFRLRSGEVLLNEGQSPEFLGRPAIYKGDPADVAFTNSLIRFRPSGAVMPEWALTVFRHHMHSGRFARESRITTNIAHLSAGRLASVEFRVPPLAEQQRIVAAIDEAFSKLDAAEAGLRVVRLRLKRMRQSVLGAAVSGRVVLQDAADTPSTNLLADVGVMPLTGHGLPPLPPGWTWVELGAIADLVRNGIFVSRPGAQPPGIPILRISAVRPLALDASDLRWADLDLSDKNVSKALLAQGDLLFTRYNGNPAFVGACAVVSATRGPLLHPDKLIRVVLNARLAAPAFVAIAASAGASRRFIESATKTTAGQAGIAGGELKRMPIPLAPITEQHRIVEEVERQLSFLEGCERAIESGLARSDALRRSVLKAAFEGILVPQDPLDDPASELLERIRAEREASDAAGNGVRGRRKVEAS